MMQAGGAVAPGIVIFVDPGGEEAGDYVEAGI
jgi:hypothetical protein